MYHRNNCIETKQLLLVAEGTCGPLFLNCNNQVASEHSPCPQTSDILTLILLIAARILSLISRLAVLSCPCFMMQQMSEGLSLSHGEK
jgi:hypothetical protein